MKGFLIALLFMVSFSFATDEFVRGLIDKLMEKGPMPGGGTKDGGKRAI